MHLLPARFCQMGIYIVPVVIISHKVVEAFSVSDEVHSLQRSFIGSVVQVDDQGERFQAGPLCKPLCGEAAAAVGCFLQTRASVLLLFACYQPASS